MRRSRMPRSVSACLRRSSKDDRTFAPVELLSTRKSSVDSASGGRGRSRKLSGRRLRKATSTALSRTSAGVGRAIPLSLSVGKSWRRGQLFDFTESGQIVPELGGDAVREAIRSPYRIIYEMRLRAVEMVIGFRASRLFVPLHC